MVQNALEWEPIPDDVLVPRRTRRRDRSVASDVQVFSSTPASVGGRRAVAAVRPPLPPQTTTPPLLRPRSAPRPNPLQRRARRPSPRVRARAAVRARVPPRRGGAHPHAALAALDEGMMRNMKANRKRARDAQTLLKRAVKLGEIKFFNRLVKDFGNDKQLGFAEEAFRRVADAGSSATCTTQTCSTRASAEASSTARDEPGATCSPRVSSRTK